MLQAALVAASLTGLGPRPVAQRLVTFAAAELSSRTRRRGSPPVRSDSAAGQRSESEALEHPVEHLLYRKQKQRKFSAGGRLIISSAPHDPLPSAVLRFEGIAR